MYPLFILLLAAGVILPTWGIWGKRGFMTLIFILAGIGCFFLALRIMPQLP